MRGFGETLNGNNITSITEITSFHYYWKKEIKE